MFKRIALCALLLLPVLSRAELLVGIGYMNGVVGPNLEWAWQLNTAYVLPGAHMGNQGLEDRGSGERPPRPHRRNRRAAAR